MFSDLLLHFPGGMVPDSAAVRLGYPRDLLQLRCKLDYHDRTARFPVPEGIPHDYQWQCCGK